MEAFGFVADELALAVRALIKAFEEPLTAKLIFKSIFRLRQSLNFDQLCEFATEDVHYRSFH